MLMRANAAFRTPALAPARRQPRFERLDGIINAYADVLRKRSRHGRRRLQLRVRSPSSATRWRRCGRATSPRTRARREAMRSRASICRPVRRFMAVRAARRADGHERRSRRSRRCPTTSAKSRPIRDAAASPGARGKPDVLVADRLRQITFTEPEYLWLLVVPALLVLRCGSGVSSGGARDTRRVHAPPHAAGPRPASPRSATCRSGSA